MSPFLASGFVLLLSLMGFYDLRHTERGRARGIGALAIIGAGAVAGIAAFHAVVASSPPRDDAMYWALGGGAVLIGLVGDVLGDLRTRSFPAAVTVVLFAGLLPGSVGDEPTIGAVLFLAAICILVGSMIGALARRVAGVVLFRDDDEDDDDAQGR